MKMGKLITKRVHFENIQKEILKHLERKKTKKALITTLKYSICFAKENLED